LLDEVLNDDGTDKLLASTAWRLKAEFIAKTPPAYHRFNDHVLVMRTSRIEPGTQALLWAAFALGEAGHASDYYPERLIYLMRNGDGDPWLGIAAELAAASMNPSQVLWLFAYGPPTGAPDAYYRILRGASARMAASTADSKQTLEFLDQACTNRKPVEGHAFIPDELIEHILVGLNAGLLTKGVTLQSLAPPKRLSDWLQQRTTTAVSKLKDRKQPLGERIRQISLLTLLSPDQSISALGVLVKPDELPDLQLAALEALGTYREPAVADMLIDAWPKMTPTLRDKATTILLSRTDRIAKLLDAIEAKKITPAQLSVAAKATLGRQKTPALAERIAKLIGDGSSSNRKEVIEKYLMAMGLKSNPGLQPTKVSAGPVVSDDGLNPSTTLADATRGAKIYETACMVCHKFADKGNDVGPHLGTIKAWTAEQLVTNILDPNREVSPNFALYLIETNDGRTLSGLITSETAGNLILKRADGGTDTVLRSEIKSLTSPGISLMPEGLEAALTPQQMADLIAFLKAP
jgi:putative heme-binding domain-containing protein